MRLPEYTPEDTWTRAKSVSPIIQMAKSLMLA